MEQDCCDRFRIWRNWFEKEGFHASCRTRLLIWIDFFLGCFKYRQKVVQVWRINFFRNPKLNCTMKLKENLENIFPNDIIKRMRRNNLYSILERLIFLITRNVACVPRRRTLRIRFVYIIEQPEHCLRFFQAINNPRHDYFPAISCNIVMTRVFFFLSLPRSLHLLPYSEEVSNREM